MILTIILVVFGSSSIGWKEVTISPKLWNARVIVTKILAKLQKVSRFSSAIPTPPGGNLASIFHISSISFGNVYNGSLRITLSYMDLLTNDVELALKKVKPQCTMGPDRIATFFVHDCATVLSQPLSLRYNLFLQNCIFPNQLKHSRIVPIHKKGIINCL